MLEAKKSAWFEKIFAIYNRNLFKRRFQALRVEGIENLNKFPSIIYCNHSSWWDCLVAFEISRKAKLDTFMMMEEKQLRNLFLFRKLGAFSVIRESPREAVKSIKYAANLLKEKQDRVIWIFPQGRILPNDIRPIEFYNGISRIAEKVENSYFLPIAIRYEFFGDWKPEIIVKIGKAETMKSKNSKELTEKLAIKLTDILDELKQDIVNNKLESYENLL
ncbi:MAG: lysophospholipid acyltransferase family protein [Acidobacteriota bacterium]|mgnify:FL=1